MSAMMTPRFTPPRRAVPRAPETARMDEKSDRNTPQSGVMLKSRPQTRRPSLYRVALMNDDFTPMEFVIEVLEKIFGKTRPEATDIMLHVHRRGVGICGVYTYEVAETKVTQVLNYAKENDHPLQCVMERE